MVSRAAGPQDSDPAQCIRHSAELTRQWSTARRFVSKVAGMGTTVGRESRTTQPRSHIVRLVSIIWDQQAEGTVADCVPACAPGVTARSQVPDWRSPDCISHWTVWVERGSSRMPVVAT